jgi:sarcosine oxidase subunit gamma
MTTATRIGAQHRSHVKAGATFGVTQGYAFASAYSQGSARSPVWLADVSHCASFGVKGPDALAWLAQQSIPTPSQSNTWQPLDSGSWGCIARLGNSEFFIEEDGISPTIARLASVPLTSGVYPVLHEDSAFVLSGVEVESVLLQVCSFNFSSCDISQRPIVMTLMAGVAVLVLPQMTGMIRRYRIWCDPSVGGYLWSTLSGIVSDCGGSLLGATQIPNGPRIVGEPL